MHKKTVYDICILAHELDKTKNNKTFLCTISKLVEQLFNKAIN